MEGRGHVDRSRAVPTHDRDEDDGVDFDSGGFGNTRVAPILLSRTPSRPSTLGAVQLLGHQAAAVAEGEAKASGVALYPSTMPPMATGIVQWRGVGRIRRWREVA